MDRGEVKENVIIHENMADLGLSREIIQGAVEYTYRVLDALDDTLVSNGEVRMPELLELANLSAVIGNLFRAGIAQASAGRFEANGPHKYPDLLSTDPDYGDIEIKVALEKNKPKGHLVKPGPHITVRYVLGNEAGSYTQGKENRGDVVWLWEIRAGYLEDGHFNVSNTAGDSGKTAVINKDGMNSLAVVFCDLEKCPYSTSGRLFKSYRSLFDPTIA